MTSNVYFSTVLIFYVLQNIARTYYYTSLLKLKKDDVKHRIYFFVILTIVTLFYSFTSYNTFFLKIGADILYCLIILSVMTNEKKSKILLYIFLHINMVLLFEITVSTSAIVLTGINFMKSTSYVITIIFQAYTTIVYIMMLCLATKLLKKKSFDLSKKLIIIVACLTLIQSCVILAICYNTYSQISINLFISIIIAAILSYILFRIVIKRVYIEYKYKKNTLYFMEQYEECLNKYLELNDRDKEISFLRHEILNQIISLEGIDNIHKG